MVELWLVAVVVQRLVAVVEWLVTVVEQWLVSVMEKWLVAVAMVEELLLAVVGERLVTVVETRHLRSLTRVGRLVEDLETGAFPCLPQCPPPTCSCHQCQD